LSKTLTTLSASLTAHISQGRSTAFLSHGCAQPDCPLSRAINVATYQAWTLDPANVLTQIDVANEREDIEKDMGENQR
jgi:hypothetical protein